MARKESFLGFMGIVALFMLTNHNTVNAQEIKSETIADSLDTPWEMQWGPNDWIWFTERKGNLKKADPKTGIVKKIDEIKDVVERSEGGLMGMVLHPNFEDTSQVFIAYNYLANGEYKVKVARFTYEQGELQNNKTIIDNIDGNNYHDGCRLIISPDRKLLITTGDAGRPGQHPQDNQSVNGKVLRFNLDGSVPNDNPIAGNPIWSKGHRNAQGLVMANGYIYSSEHGPDSDDELNIIKKGRNYGWPEVKGFCDSSYEKTFCRDSNVVEPLEAWSPPEAVCGIDYYGSSRIADWENSILMATLGFNRNDGRALFQLQLNEKGDSIIHSKPFFKNDFGRLRDVLTGPDGRVYIATSNRDGRGTPEDRDDRIIQLDKQGSSISGEKRDWFTIEPNPFQNATRVNFKHQKVKIELRLSNNSGQVLWKRTLNDVKHYTISGDELTAGIYFLKILDGSTGAQKVKKLIVR